MIGRYVSLVELDTICGEHLDAYASRCGLKRRQLPGPWYARAWRWVWRLPAPLEADEALRIRCVGLPRRDEGAS